MTSFPPLLSAASFPPLLSAATMLGCAFRRGLANAHLLHGLHDLCRRAGQSRRLQLQVSPGDAAIVTRESVRVAILSLGRCSFGRCSGCMILPVLGAKKEQKLRRVRVLR